VAAATVVGIHEALLSVTCKYLSCAGLLPAATVARLAKKSLHARLRPLASVPVAAPGVGGAQGHGRTAAEERDRDRDRDGDDFSASLEREMDEARSQVGTPHCLLIACHAPLLTYTAAVACRRQAIFGAEGRRRLGGAAGDVSVVTLSRAEFEEMFLRCAFAVWELSEACSAPGGRPREAALAALHSRAGAAASAAAAPAVLRYCEEAAATAGSSSSNSGGSSGDDTSASWGVDFVGPYARTLLALAPLPGQRKTPPPAPVSAEAAALDRVDRQRMYVDAYMYLSPWLSPSPGSLSHLALSLTWLPPSLPSGTWTRISARACPSRPSRSAVPPPGPARRRPRRRTTSRRRPRSACSSC
jgi:hypothetical protein